MRLPELCRHTLWQRPATAASHATRGSAASVGRTLSGPLRVKGALPHGSLLAMRVRLLMHCNSVHASKSRGLHVCPSAGARAHGKGAPQSPSCRAAATRPAARARPLPPPPPGAGRVCGEAPVTDYAPPSAHMDGSCCTAVHTRMENWGSDVGTPLSCVGTHCPHTTAPVLLPCLHRSAAAPHPCCCSLIKTHAHFAPPRQAGRLTYKADRPRVAVDAFDSQCGSLAVRGTYQAMTHSGPPSKQRERGRGGCWKRARAAPPTCAADLR